jgi:hypothetical protein
MLNGSLWLLVVMLTASAGWFYLSGSYRYSMRCWGMPLWQGVACAQFCGLIIITFGSLFALSAEDTAREAYLKQNDPARYAAQKKHEQAEAQAKTQREQAWEAKQQHEAAVEKARKWEEEYQAACRTPEAFLNMAQDIARERLKSPASAKFASWRDPAVKYSGTTDPKTKECVWAVKSYVDSHNSFGAMMRSGFMAEIRLLRDKQMTMRLVDFSAYPMP